MLHFKAKKPINYVLIRQSFGEIQAEIITQIEANELSKRIQVMDNNEGSTIWIQTVNESLYAGDFPKNYPHNMPAEYKNIIEQLHFLNGDIEVLAENIDNNSWFFPEPYSLKMSYFKMHIAPDEALNAQNLSYVENKLVKKLVEPLEIKQNADRNSYSNMIANKLLSKFRGNFFPDESTPKSAEDNSDSNTPG